MEKSEKVDPNSPKVWAKGPSRAKLGLAWSQGEVALGHVPS